MDEKDELPPLPAKAPKRNGFRYRSQYGVILICPDQASQEALFNALTAIRTTRIKVVVT
ncbi:hypothetical protein [Rhizobium sp. FKY42]|uniref:hypothetical protein n=1 Tax=Rhizobium sp. FKY42 TaxID=2562310 RepID=UPI001484D7D9|nr:hypothetical protein [Rhizobium sp. FKY42]